MDRLRTVSDSARNVATAAVLFIAAYTDAARKLPEAGLAYGISDFIIQIFIAVAGAIMIVAFDHAVRAAISASRLLRKCIMGSDDIEGYWIETMREKSTGREIGFAVESIAYVNDTLHIDGKQFDLDGSLRGTYWTKMHDYSESQSQLVFGSKHFGDIDAEKAGYSQVHYLRNGRTITGYVGYYTDSDALERIDISAQRLLDPRDQRVAAALLGRDLRTSDNEAVLELYKRQSTELLAAAGVAR